MASEIENIIEEIEDYIDSCKPAPLSSSKIIVNRDDLDSLIDELKTKTPVEIRRYQKIVNNQEAILSDARKKADQIIEDAHVQTAELISREEVMKRALEQANEMIAVASQQAEGILDKATTEANEIRTSAIAYTDSLLNNIQEILVTSMDTTRARNEKFLTTMQGYLDTVIKNRMELSPSPVDMVMESEMPKENVRKEAAAPEKNQAAGQKPAPKPEAAAAPAPSDEKKQKSGIDVPEKFFNKE